jgi:anionic glutamate receptor
MFGNSRWQGNPKKEVNYREEEKKILDSVLGPSVYDKRIRPSGINSTGKLICWKMHKKPLQN